MTNKLLILAAGLDGSGLQNDRLPSLLSPAAVNDYLVGFWLNFRPELIVLAAVGKAEGKRIKDKKIKIIPEELLGAPVAVLMEKVSRRPATSDLIIMTREFFPLQPDLIRKVLKFHRKSGNDLTLTGEKLAPENGGSGEDYFVYPGLAVIKASAGQKWLRRARPFKPGWELDVVGLVEAAWSEERKLGFYWMEETDRHSFLQISTPGDFARLAAHFRNLKIAELEKGGVFFLDPGAVWIDPEVKVGRGTVIYPWVVVEGKSRIGRDCLIYPHCHIINSRIGHRVKVFGATVMEESTIEDEVQVGPFSRLRPETRLRRGSRVGNFVEMKKTLFGRRSKAMHLSYLGDARVEDEVNVGAGTITCNYDGMRKHKTFIGREAFIGSGTELVAPVRVGRGAYVAAGSTITENVKPGALAIARARQVQKPGWVKKRKAELKASGKKTSRK
ncbi:MAG: DapH/DapD/GlmU-related protein [Candidatus Saccharicenans sp.]